MCAVIACRGVGVSVGVLSVCAHERALCTRVSRVCACTRMCVREHGCAVVVCEYTCACVRARVYT